MPAAFFHAADYASFIRFITLRRRHQPEAADAFSMPLLLPPCLRRYAGCADVALPLRLFAALRYACCHADTIAVCLRRLFTLPLRCRCRCRYFTPALRLRFFRRYDMLMRATISRYAKMITAFSAMSPAALRFILSHADVAIVAMMPAAAIRALRCLLILLCCHCRAPMLPPLHATRCCWRQEGLGRYVARPRLPPFTMPPPERHAAFLRLAPPMRTLFRYFAALCCFYDAAFTCRWRHYAAAAMIRRCCAA